MKINTKILMSASALFMGSLGITFSFLPQEILHFGEIEPTVLPSLLLQIFGSLLMGFAMVNWMAKDILVGGIYSRPVAVGNFMHFVVGALALFKGVMKSPDVVVLAAAIVYTIFAIVFGIVLFMRSPIQE